MNIHLIEAIPLRISFKQLFHFGWTDRKASQDEEALRAFDARQN